MEGALYGLASVPDARPASPRPIGAPVIRSQPSIPRGITRRLDVDIALRHTLSAQDRRVVYEHYVTHDRRHSYRERKRIIGTLLLALNGGDPLDGADS